MFVRKQFNSAISRQIPTVEPKDIVEEIVEDQKGESQVKEEIPPEPEVVPPPAKTKKSKKKAGQKKEEVIVVKPIDVTVVEAEDTLPSPPPAPEEDISKEMEEKINELKTLMKEPLMVLIKNIVEAITIGQYGTILTPVVKEEDNPLMVNSTFCVNRTMYFIHPDSDDIHYRTKVAVAITCIFGHVAVEFSTEELEKYAELSDRGEDFYSTSTFYNNLSMMLINNIMEGYIAMTQGVDDEYIEDDLYDYT